MSGYTQSLDNIDQTSRAAVGGKAMSLARMIHAGIPVPPAYAVTTEAYQAFVDHNDLEPVFVEHLAGVDFADADQVELASGRVRAQILQAKVPDEVVEEVLGRYADLVKDRSGYVAVRSSGTAEDLGDASFAGLYDSFLDVRGEDEVVDALRRCWASLWTARCTSYRHRIGIDQRDAQVGVVVQEMVEAETAGVLFTANPLNARTDEMVVNANWGLGESIASGVVTPDEFVLESSTLSVKRRELGSKLLKVARNEHGPGTTQLETTESERSSWTLDSEALVALGTIARRAVNLAGGLPQDIEWAAREGEFLILQSRDVTGAEFVWNEDVESWQTAPDDDNTTWSNIWAQQYWTGAVSPLFYSVRGRELRNSDERLFTLWGFDDLASVRRFKFYRSTVYFSSDADRKYYQYVLPPRLRGAAMGNLPPSWREDAAAASFDVGKSLRMFARIRALTSDHGPIRGLQSVYDFIERQKTDVHWPTQDELRGWSDAEVRRELQSKMKMFEDYLTILRPAFHIYSATAFALLRELLATWYDGPNNYAFEDLISGLPKRTAMLQEQIDLWELAEQVRTSPSLRDLLESHRDGEFFEAAKRVEDGREFLRAYEVFLAEHGHRGHQDRDFWYPRRVQDASLDYQSLRAMVEAEAPSPTENEHRLVAKRLESTREVEERIRRLPFGAVRVELFRVLLDYVHRFLVLRDDERPFADLVTWGKKIAADELGRRLHERGLIEEEDDYFFLAEYEIYDVLEGRDQRPLTHAKIRARRTVFERALAREETISDYLRGNVPLDVGDLSVTDEEGVFQGTGTSRGTVTGRACVVPDLREIGKLQKGEILICNSTDPGWTPAFGKISGLVLEAGGMLSHGACLSREYGLPAVTLSGAMKKIPHGATVTVNGESGRVVVHADE